MIRWPFFEFFKPKPFELAPPPMSEPETKVSGQKIKGYLDVGELIMEPEQIQLFQQ